MIPFLSNFLNKSMQKVRDEKSSSSPVKWPQSAEELPDDEKRHLEELVILGVLLHEVANADGYFSPEEEKSVKEILARKGKLDENETALVLTAAKDSAEARFDLQGFTREVNKTPYEERVKVIKLLFEVAMADNNLSNVEIESVRKIAKLFWVEHKDFIDAKLEARDGK